MEQYFYGIIEPILPQIYFYDANYVPIWIYWGNYV